MRVVLVSTYDLGRQPFGLASPAAWLRARGHEVATIDTSVSPLPPKLLRQADVVAFHLAMHTATRLALPHLQSARDVNPQARLIAYGLYAPLNAPFLREQGIHDIIGGEFEQALLDAIEGRSSQQLVHLDRLPFRPPDRSTLPALARYAPLVLDGERRPAGSTEASRGCLHRCRHCPIVPVYNGAFRIVPRDIVLEDIRTQFKAGARHITFSDPDFFNGPTHARQLVEALHREWPGLTYDATIKVEHLLKHRDLLSVLAQTGCLFITTAVESVEDHVLDKLQKGHTRADFLKALQLARTAGIHLNPTFVPFTPWTTLAGYRSLLQLLLEENLIDAVAPVQLSLRLLIPAGSRILELEDLKLDGFDPAGLLHRWRHPDPALDALASQVFKIVSAKQNQSTPRREVFAQVWQAAHGQPPPENYRLLPRAAIPYLDEPWYC